MRPTFSEHRLIISSLYRGRGERRKSNDAYMKKTKLLHRALSGSKSLRFNEVVGLAEAFGFRLSRVSGSHHIFVHKDVPELLNLQDVGGEAKPYQVRQFLRLVERYNLKLGQEGGRDEQEDGEP